MLPVTALTTYMFCPRKLYLGQVLGVKEEPGPAAALGILRHRSHEELAEREGGLVENLAVTTPEAIAEAYRAAAHAAVHVTLLRNRGFLFKAGMQPEAAEERLTLEVGRFAGVRARQVAQCAAGGLTGRALWEALEPKLRPEFSISSEEMGLRGKIDLVEVFPSLLRPVELKSGPAPRQGVWREQRIQVAAYALLLEQRFKAAVPAGAIRYLESGEDRIVPVNPFLRSEVLELLETVRRLLASPALPPLLDNPKKCAACGLREQCYRMAGHASFAEAMAKLGARVSTSARNS
jgi:CRISPR-associated exonuclease Cas4